MQKLNITVFDNNSVAAETLESLLAALGHMAQAFTDEHQFRSHICTTAHDSCDLLIINAGGAELVNLRLIADAGRFCPDAKIVCATGAGEAAKKIQQAGARIDRFLHKPFTVEELKESIVFGLVLA
jgi:DNA-binding response OmpR family regulator